MECVIGGESRDAIVGYSVLCAALGTFDLELREKKKLRKKRSFKEEEKRGDKRKSRTEEQRAVQLYNSFLYYILCYYVFR